MRQVKHALAVTMGEPSGIGPDITLTAWLERSKRDLPAFYVLADPQFLKERAKHLGLRVPIKVCTPQSARAEFYDALPVVPLSGAVKAENGTPDTANGALVIESIETAVRHVHAGLACGVVTNPISKKVLYDGGFAHPGHTEYLGELAHQYWGVHSKPVMLFAGPELMTVPLTVHIPLHKVPETLTKELILEQARIVHKDLKNRFGMSAPVLAVAGLNPHAGEDGTMGREDLEVIAPAIDQLKSEGIDARGPFPADTLFNDRARESYDVVLATYHDQALIPVKTIAFDDTVNVTLGLPFVRTSPDHGTAFDIAGTGKASPDSLSAAMRLAAALSEPEII